MNDIADQEHPEKREYEIFIGNSTEEDFHQSSYNTKRLGRVAYDTSNVVIDSYSRLRPFFVGEAEYLDHMAECKNDA